MSSNRFGVRRKIQSRDINVFLTEEGLFIETSIDKFEDRFLDLVYEKLPQKDLSWSFKQKTIYDLVGNAVSEAFTQAIRELKEESLRITQS